MVDWRVVGSVLGNHLRVRPFPVPDRFRKNLHRESVRIISAAHPHTYLTDERGRQRHHHRWCRFRV